MFILRFSVLLKRRPFPMPKKRIFIFAKKEYPKVVNLNYHNNVSNKQCSDPDILHKNKINKSSIPYLNFVLVICSDCPSADTEFLTGPQSLLRR